MSTFEIIAYSLPAAAWIMLLYRSVTSGPADNTDVPGDW
jgi:hypothetical protein